MRRYHIEISEKGRWAYVPAEYGRYLRTHVCVLYVDCTDKLCLAAKDNPCINLPRLAKFDTRVPQCKVHASRMVAYKKFLRDQPKINEGGKVIKMKRRRKRG